MYVQYGVRLVGITYLILGVLGFLPIGALHPHHGEGVGADYLFGLVAVNWLHNLIHLAIGGLLPQFLTPRDQGLFLRRVLFLRNLRRQLVLLAANLGFERLDGEAEDLFFDRVHRELGWEPP